MGDWSEQRYQKRIALFGRVHPGLRDSRAIWSPFAAATAIRTGGRTGSRSFSRNPGPKRPECRCFASAARRFPAAAAADQPGAVGARRLERTSEFPIAWWQGGRTSCDLSARSIGEWTAGPCVMRMEIVTRTTFWSGEPCKCVAHMAFGDANRPKTYSAATRRGCSASIRAAESLIQPKSSSMVSRLASWLVRGWSQAIGSAVQSSSTMQR